MGARKLILASVLAGFALVATQSEAQVNVTPRVNTGTAASKRQAAPAGAAAGATSGTGAAAVESDPSAEELARKRNAELERVRKRIDDDANLLKADQERKAQEDREKALAAKQQRESQEERKRAAFEREREQARERKRLEQERQAQCEVKPVMSDDDIARCRAARGG
jgi:parvulin-like peptidyl-prolyl isomerase